MTTEDPLTKHDFAPLLNKVIDNRLTKTTIQNAFRTTGCIHGILKQSIIQNV